MAWGDYDSRIGRRPLMVALTALSIVVVIAFSAGVYRLGTQDNERRKEAIDTTTTTTTVTTPPGFNPSLDPGIPTTLLVPSSTSTIPVPPTTAPAPPGPEAEIWTPEDLRRFYTLDRSQLQETVFERSKTTAVELLTARTTGVGKEKFTEFFDNSPGMPVIENLVIDGAYAEVAPTDRRYVRTTVWWRGTQYYSGQRIRQARTVVFLAPGTLQPVGYRQLPDENTKADPGLDTVYVD